MTKFYATKDAEDGCIAQDADIFSFTSEAEARAFLSADYNPSEWAWHFEAGYFGDCWVKCVHEPRPDSGLFAPFAVADLYVLGPGQHPGGRFWWVEPRPEILTIVPRWIGEE